MNGGGPVSIQADHWLAEVGAEWLPPQVGGKIELDNHLVEWLFLDGLMLKNAVMALGQGWFLRSPVGKPVRGGTVLR